MDTQAKYDSKVDPARMRKARKLMGKARRKKAIEPVILGPQDAAIIIRGNGRVQIHHARGDLHENSPAFWGVLFAWLFKADEDAAERRKVIMDDFLVDVQIAQKKAEEAREAAVEEAEARAVAKEPTEPVPDTTVPAVELL